MVGSCAIGSAPEYLTGKDINQLGVVKRRGRPQIKRGWGPGPPLKIKAGPKCISVGES